MTLPATVEADERLRLFVGLPVPHAVAHELADWAARLHAPEARPVPAGNLHLTLAFLGYRPAGDLERVEAAVGELAGRPAPVLGIESYRETRAVGMLALADEEGRGAALAEHVQRRLEEEGLYRAGRRPWLPHVTVLRFRRRPRLMPTLPNVCSFAPSEAGAYLSVLRPSGARYEIVHAVSLKQAP